MRKISKQLTLVYILLVAIALTIVVLYELDVLESGALADSKQTEFVALTVMVYPRWLWPSWACACSSSP